MLLARLPRMLTEHAFFVALFGGGGAEELRAAAIIDAAWHEFDANWHEASGGGEEAPACVGVEPTPFSRATFTSHSWEEFAEEAEATPSQASSVERRCACAKQETIVAVSPRRCYFVV